MFKSLSELVLFHHSMQHIDKEPFHFRIWDGSIPSYLFSQPNKSDGSSNASFPIIYCGIKIMPHMKAWDKDTKYDNGIGVEVH